MSVLLLEQSSPTRHCFSRVVVRYLCPRGCASRGHRAADHVPRSAPHIWAMLIESGVDIYTVSRLMGHSDVRITEKVYAPLSGKFLAKEVSKLGRHLGPMLIRAVETDSNSA